jgi:hypothetical protein
VQPCQLNPKKRLLKALKVLKAKQLLLNKIRPMKIGASLICST